MASTSKEEDEALLFFDLSRPIEKKAPLLPVKKPRSEVRDIEMRHFRKRINVSDFLEPDLRVPITAYYSSFLTPRKGICEATTSFINNLLRQRRSIVYDLIYTEVEVNRIKFLKEFEASLQYWIELAFREIGPGYDEKPMKVMKDGVMVFDEYDEGNNKVIILDDREVVPISYLMERDQMELLPERMKRMRILAPEGGINVKLKRAFNRRLRYDSQFSSLIHKDENDWEDYDAVGELKQIFTKHLEKVKTTVKISVATQT